MTSDSPLVAPPLTHVAPVPPNKGAAVVRRIVAVLLLGFASVLLIGAGTMQALNALASSPVCWGPPFSTRPPALPPRHSTSPYK